MSYGTTTSVFHLAKWQYIIRYHDQRLSHGTKVESTTPSSDVVYFFSDLGKLCDFLRIHILKDDIKKKNKKKIEILGNQEL